MNGEAAGGGPLSFGLGGYTIIGVARTVQFSLVVLADAGLGIAVIITPVLLSRNGK